MDLAMLSLHYIQKGLLFKKPSQVTDQEYSTQKLVETLKDSLSLTLIHFYPLAGQFVTQINEDEHECSIFVDCNKGPGARFIYATLDMAISDIISPTDVPLVVQSFFDHDRAVNHDGHERPLLSFQVTELVDGVFIGCSMNHAIVDGTSYWHFWNVWSETHRANNGKRISILRLPIHKRWFPDGYGTTIHLPFTDPNEFVNRYEPNELRERNFHFSAESIARLKVRANEESNTTICSFQILSALVWRWIVRANCLSENQVTNCRFAANNRHRLDLPLLPNHFGAYVTAVLTTTTFGELLENSLGWAASLLHPPVANHNNKVVRDFLDAWLKSPFIYQLSMSDSKSVMMGSSPRFEIYENEFVLGKAIGVRSGYANKFPGKVMAYPGYEGGGSVDLEICLPPLMPRAS